ncbi:MULTISPECIES: globin domain-containing protein [Streptomycetaceae]|nr:MULTISPECIES: globin domain-containing protein [Streptomycetaceae]CCB75874.1 putative flavohemoprotein [Streptantibioticus cattleyicolor NRRL 8057 = DSM 46488]
MDALTTRPADRETGSGEGRSAPAAPPAHRGAGPGRDEPGDAGGWSWFSPARPTGAKPEPADGDGTGPEPMTGGEGEPEGVQGGSPGSGPHAPGRGATGASWFGAAPANPAAATRTSATTVSSAAAFSSAARSATAPPPPTRPPTAAPPAPAPAPSRPATAREDTDADLIRRTMAVVEPIADRTTSHFYALLFLSHPEIRELFPAAMDVQRDRLFTALVTAARLADQPQRLTEYLSQLGRGHRKYGTRPEHYPAVGEALIGALSRYAAEMWNEEVEAAWVRAYTTISQIMIDAAARDERTAPAWWQAEVVGHELRTPQIAVITVRPDQPYPFRAGQYVAVETPWWPRVWRHYSPASAPRPDGLLTFHVKAVPAGWVSTALVHHARPGDVIRLGPPAGSMVVDHTSDDGLLCLGGGTGIAPIKALVEDVAEHGRARPVEVFYGARHDDDLYDLDTMVRLAQRHRWLSVRPVVSAGGAGLVGDLPDMVRRHGPWPSYVAYLSGPPGMIRGGVDALVATGMPTERIRHDALDELVTGRGPGLPGSPLGREVDP